MGEQKKIARKLACGKGPILIVHIFHTLPLSTVIGRKLHIFPTTALVRSACFFFFTSPLCIHVVQTPHTSASKGYPTLTHTHTHARARFEPVKAPSSVTSAKRFISLAKPHVRAPNGFTRRTEPNNCFLGEHVKKISFKN